MLQKSDLCIQMWAFWVDNYCPEEDSVDLAAVIAEVVDASFYSSCGVEDLENIVQNCGVSL